MDKMSKVDTNSSHHLNSNGVGEDEETKVTNDSIEDKSSFLSPMAPKGRRNIMSDVTVRKDFSVTLNLDSTVESEVDMSLESSARQHLREVKKRGLYSIDIDDTIIPSGNNTVMNESTADEMRKKRTKRHVSFDFEFSQSSIEPSINSEKNSIEDVCLEAQQNPMHSASFGKDNDAPTSEQKNPENSQKETSLLSQNVTSTNKQLDGTYLVQVNSSGTTEGRDATYTINEKRISSTDSFTKAQSTEISQTKVTPKRDSSMNKSGTRSESLRRSQRSKISSTDENNEEPNKTFQENNDETEAALLGQENKANLEEKVPAHQSQRKSIFDFMKKKDDDSSQKENQGKETFDRSKSPESLRRSNRNSNPMKEVCHSPLNLEISSQDKAEDTPDKPESRESLRRSPRKPAADQESSMNTTSKKIKIQAEETPKKANSPAPRRSQRKSMADTKEESHISMKGEKTPDKTNSPAPRRSQRKSFSNQKNDSIPCLQPSFNLESLDYEDDPQSLHSNNSQNEEFSVSKAPTRVTQRSRSDKKSLQTSVKNNSKLGNQENDPKSPLKSVENTVKEFTPEVCSTFIDLECSNTLRSSLGKNNSLRVPKPSVDIKRNAKFSQPELEENELVLSMEIKETTPLVEIPAKDIELSVDEDQATETLAIDNDKSPVNDPDEARKDKNLIVDIQEAALQSESNHEASSIRKRKSTSLSNEDPEDAALAAEPKIVNAGVEKHEIEDVSSRQKRKSPDLPKNSNQLGQINETDDKVNLKKRRTVKTADSRDGTVILNKSSLSPRRTRSSTKSLDSSLNVSSILQVNRRKQMFHSTPIPKKKLRDETAEMDSSHDFSKLSDIISIEKLQEQSSLKNKIPDVIVTNASSRSGSSKVEFAKPGTSSQSVRSAPESSSRKEITRQNASRKSGSKSHSKVNESANRSNISSVNNLSFGNASGNSRSQRGSSRRGFVESFQNETNDVTTFESTYEYDSSLDSTHASSTGPDPIAIWSEKLKKNLNKKPTKKKEAKLYMPRECKWITKNLYDYLIKKLTPKYKIEAKKYSEAFVMDLHYVFNKVTHGHPEEADTLRTKGKELGIFTNELQFSIFLHKIMPFEFNIKVLAVGGAFNSQVEETDYEW